MRTKGNFNYNISLAIGGQFVHHRLSPWATVNIRLYCRICNSCRQWTSGSSLCFSSGFALVYFVGIVPLLFVGWWTPQSSTASVGSSPLCSGFLQYSSCVVAVVAYNIIFTPRSLLCLLSNAPIITKWIRLLTAAVVLCRATANSGNNRMKQYFRP